MTVNTSDADEPYVGPRPYERADSHLFFGRGREAEEILSLVIAHPIVLLYAQSGAGKTSLLNARVIPLLEGQYAQVFGPARVGGDEQGDEARTEGQNVFVRNALMSLQVTEGAPSGQSLAQMSFSDFLGAQPPPSGVPDGIKSLRVIIFDQFEELFTAYIERWQQREGFFEAVSAALDRDPHLRVLFALREEYLAGMDNFSQLVPERLRTRFRLEGLREARAKEAVSGPLEFTDRSITEEGLDKLVRNLLKIPCGRGARAREVDTEFVEPVQLQLVCQDMWESLPPEVKRIDTEHVKQFADVDQALEKYYEKCLGKLAAEGVNEGGLRKWFERELITPQGGRSLVFLDESTGKAGGLSKRSVLRLEKLRLIRPVPRGGATWYELTHERFIYPIRRSNEDQSRERGREKFTLDEFEERAQSWEQAGRPREQLLTGEEIKAVELLRKTVGDDISESDLLKQFVLESETERLRKRQLELAREKKSLIVQKIYLIFALVVIGGLAFYAFMENRRTKDANERAARALQVARGEQATFYSGVRGKEYDALALGIEALGDPLKNVPPRDEALEGIRAALRAADRKVWLRECISSPGGFFFSPNGQLVMAVSNDKLHVWDTASGEHLYSKPEQGAVRWTQVAFSHSDRLLLAVGTPLPGDGGQQKFGQMAPDKPAGGDEQEPKTVVLVLNARDGGAAGDLQDKLQGASGLRMSRDERRILSILEGGEVAILDVEGGSGNLRKPFPKDRWSQIDLSPDGRRLVGINDTDNAMEVWDTEAVKPVSDPLRIEMIFSEETSDTIKFSPDGNVGVLARETPGVATTAFVLWDSETGRKLASFSEPLKVRHFSFMPGGRRIFVVGDTLAKIYELDGRLSSSRPLPPEKILSYGDGFLITLGGEGDKVVVSLWDVESTDPALASRPLVETEGHKIQKATHSLSRKLIVTATEDNITQVWEVREPTNFDSYSVAELRKAACDKLRHQREYQQVRAQCGEQ